MSAGDNAHCKMTGAERLEPINRLVEFDHAGHRERAARPVLDVVLAPLEEIMIARAPIDHAIVVADRAQRRLECSRITGDGGRQYGLAEGDAVESIIAYNEFFRPMRPTDQRIAAIVRADESLGDEIDPLRNRRQPA